MDSLSVGPVVFVHTNPRLCPGLLEFNSPGVVNPFPHSTDSYFPCLLNTAYYLLYLFCSLFSEGVIRTLFINLVEHLFSSFIIHLSSLPFLRLFVSPLFHNSIFPACGKQACSIYEIRNFSPPPLTVTQSYSLFTFSFLRPPYPPVGGGGGLLLS